MTLLSTPSRPRLHSVIEVSAMHNESSYELSDFYLITESTADRVSGYLIKSDYAHDLKDFDAWTELKLTPGLWRELEPVEHA